MPYRPTIGLEVHAELKTKTKMFCASANDPDETRPNVNVCPVCLAHPGTLPVINREAVGHMVRMGTAVGGTIADFSEFDRKSYFYPDIPKGYQISQYAYPLVSGGSLAGVALTRIHLEEDTARSIHAGGHSLIDFNRAGIPLMELVTEPVITDAETAGRFARELQLLLRTLGAGDANLEKGEMRIEANISVSKQEGVFGTKVEVKNLNSFRSVERAIAFEIARQTELLDSGGAVVQETRGWDEAKQETFHQRFKEGSADYRYFPEPDLPKLIISDVPAYAAETLRAAMPELPWERRARYQSLGLSNEAVSYLGSALERGAFFDAVCAVFGTDLELTRLAANYIVSDLGGWYAKNGGSEYERITPESFSVLMRRTADGTVSSRGAKEVLAILAADGGDTETIIAAQGLAQMSDTQQLLDAVRDVIKEQPKAVAEYRGGKEASLQFLVGQAMRATKGAGNPSALHELFISELAEK